MVELEKCIFSIELPRIIIPLLTMFQQKNTFLYRFLQINISSSREHQTPLRIRDHAIDFYQYCSLFSFKANCLKVKISLVQCQYCFLVIARRKQMSFWVLCIKLSLLSFNSGNLYLAKCDIILNHKRIPTLSFLLTLATIYNMLRSNLVQVLMELSFLKNIYFEVTPWVIFQSILSS